MSTFTFELVRTIPAPIDEVFARIIDIEGYNDWMPKRGTMLKKTRQTSPGEPRVGTTYVDTGNFGRELPGDIAELEPPHTIVYHWWDRSKSGKTRSEGWPEFRLEEAGPGQTLVRHRGTLKVYGPGQVAMPLFRRLAVRERTVTLEALVASFGG